MSRSPRRSTLAPFGLAPLLVLASCGGHGVSDEEGARLAYVGLDASVDQIIDLGFEGFNEASRANIPTQMGTGAVSGTITVGGKVDQGASNNKEMTLDVAYANYSDGAVANEDIDDIVYVSSAGVVADLSLEAFRTRTSPARSPAA